LSSDTQGLASKWRARIKTKNKGGGKKRKEEEEEEGE